MLSFMASGEFKLIVQNLSVHYFEEKGIVTRAVNGVSFNIKGTESIGIAGESACGKSTLGSALMRSLPPQGRIVSGAVLLDGKDIVKLEDAQYDKHIRWKKIAMVFQSAMNSLDPVFTVHDQMEEILRFHGSKGDTDDRILISLQDVGLDSTTAKKYPHELSGGMKQRVVIAMALLHDPDILVADEPTTALDVIVQAQIVKLLKYLKVKKGLTIIVISHDLGVIFEIADQVAIMYAGEIVELGSNDEVLKKPKHPYTQLLVSSIPRLSSGENIVYIKGQPPDLKNLSDGCKFLNRCPYAMDECKKGPPAVKTDLGFVLCWLYK
jgi:peptide/nickel transport system ATP-binding protein